MIDPSLMMPSPFGGALDPFSESSRYRGIPLITCTDADGNEIVYVGRRWVPQPQRLAEVGRFQVSEGDRIDNIAATQLGDPELYWRLADANRALRPMELTERAGRWLRITLPDGVPGPKAE